MDYSILLFLDYLLDCENDFGASSCTRSRFFSDRVQIFPLSWNHQLALIHYLIFFQPF
jgi:hypothetical protein